MSKRKARNGSSAWWVRRVTNSLAVELWRGDGPHIRLVSTSYPIKLALGDQGELSDAIQDGIEALSRVADAKSDPRGPVINLTSEPIEVVIDQDGVVIEPTRQPLEGVRDQPGTVVDLGEPAEVIIDQGGAAAIHEEKTLECDICGRRAIVVIDDSERTVLCDECFDGYYQEKPHWGVEQYLERQAQELDCPGDSED